MTDTEPGWNDLVAAGIEVASFLDAAEQSAQDAKRASDSACWRLGDLACQVAPGRYSRVLAKYAEEIGVNYESLRVYRWVASKYPESVRRLTLSFAHHEALAAFSDGPDPVFGKGDRQRWLDLAEAEDWSARELRFNAKKYTFRDPLRERMTPEQIEEADRAEKRSEEAERAWARLWSACESLQDNWWAKSVLQRNFMRVQLVIDFLRENYVADLDKRDIVYDPDIDDEDDEEDSEDISSELVDVDDEDDWDSLFAPDKPRLLTAHNAMP